MAYADYNPSRSELEVMIEEVAVKRAIPSVLLKSIARVESVFKHFKNDGSPRTSGTCIGLMMVNNKYGGYDGERLKYDIKYNIEAGADVLLNKWSMSSYQKVSSVGNMDPNILENWYFALWAYNGWAQSNNPHMLPSYVKTYTYQQLIYKVSLEEYNQPINNIDISYLPSTGKPSRSLVVPTPSYINYGGIALYDIGDYVVTDGIRNEYYLRNEPAGKYIHTLSANQFGLITEGPVLQTGYYWYKVYIDDYTQGWIERNWLLRTGDAENGIYNFNDIAFHWARKYIMKLYNKGIISEAQKYNPNKNISKEEFCILLSKTLASSNKETNNEESAKLKNKPILFSDLDKISSWALDYVVDINNKNYLTYYQSEFNPTNDLKRKEAALIMSNIFELNSDYETSDINQIFNDIAGLDKQEIEAIKKVYTDGLLSGKGLGQFQPEENLTRAEAAVVMIKLLEKLSE